MERVGSVPKNSIAEYLHRLKLITPDQAVRAEEYRKANEGVSFTHALVECGEISGDGLVVALSRSNGDGSMDVDGFQLLPHVINLIPEKMAFDFQILPIHRIQKVLFAAVPRPWKYLAEHAKLQKQVGMHLETVPVGDADVPGLVSKSHQMLKARSLRERRLGQALVERGLLTSEQLETALKMHRHKGMRLGRALMDLGYISEQALYEVLSERMRAPLKKASFVVERLQTEISRKVTKAFAEHNMILPYAREGETLRVATSYPIDLNLLETIKALTSSLEVEQVLVGEDELHTVIKAVYDDKKSTVKMGSPASENEDSGARSNRNFSADDLDIEVSVEDVREDEWFSQDIDTDPGVPKLINYMLYQAVKKGASDIHVEHYEDRTDVKFRIDGQMRSIEGIPIDQENAGKVISKLKIDAQLDIAERRKPQDGSFRKRFGKKLLVDFRLATQPTLYGENAVIRILDRTSPLPTIPQLGMPDRILKKYMRQITSPQGMIIFTGPTGSGKTTTLYCTLEVLRKQNLKIITAEDPIEYQFDGIQQCQVNEQIGNTFAKYLRGFLRQDPDCILIGEVRDEQTALNAVRSAITGHLIFSTIHASDTIGVIRRFTDMEVDTNMLSMSLVSIVYQRLVRRICVNCKEPYQHPLEDLQEMKLDEVFQGVQLFHGKGCGDCDNSGYRGRVAVYEMWEPGEEEKDAIAKNVDEREMRATAIKNGMLPLVVDAIAKVKAGITTMEELKEVIPYQQIVRAKEFMAME